MWTRTRIEHTHARDHPAQLIGRTIEVREYPAAIDGSGRIELVETDNAVGQLRGG
jgi:hypothetical protein